MPNWCNNTLELQHEDPTMIARAAAAIKEGKLLNEFIPVPEDLQITAGFLGEGDAQNKLEAQEKANVEKYGYKNWYEFCVNEWGTKWDVGGNDYPDAQLTEDGKKMTVGFDSAWSPPCDAMAKLCDLGFSVRLYYYEPGMCFAGIWEDGNDEFYDLSGYNSTQAAEDLPTVLDEMFGISECMAEYEEDNKEEEAE